MSVEISIHTNKHGITMPKLLITRKLPSAVEAAFSNAFSCNFNDLDTPYSSEELLKSAESCDGLVITSMDKMTASVIGGLPASIKIIATVSVGLDHIDIPAARSKGIVVTNTPDVLTNATADISVLLMLGAARGASWGDRMVRADRWPPPSMVKPLGFEMSGRRLGIVGMGRIGYAVAKRAAAFEMEIHYHNRKKADIKEAFQFHAQLEDMLPHCDFLSLNCALSMKRAGSSMPEHWHYFRMGPSS